MRKPKTQEERLWGVITRQIGHTRKAKHIFNYVKRQFMRAAKTIQIRYAVDTSELEKATRTLAKLDKYKSYLKRK